MSHFAKPLSTTNASTNPAQQALSSAIFAILLAALLLALSACAGPKDKPTTPKPARLDPQTGLPITSEPAPTVSLTRANAVPVSDFIADREIEFATGRVVGPLLGYTLTLESLLDKTDTYSPRGGRLVGEAIVFGLPKSGGDTGPAYKTALKRAAEIFTGSPDEGKVLTEFVEEGTIALVRIETLGFPSNRKANEILPVSISPMGNALDIRGGHIYSTNLRCDRTGEVLAMHPFGHFEDDEVEEYSVVLRKPWSFDDVLDLNAPVTPKPTNEANIPDKPLPEVVTPEGLRLRRWLLKEGFRTVRATGWQEAGRDEIRLTVGGFKYDQDGNPMPAASIDEEMIEAVVAALSRPEYRMYVERDKLVRTKVLVVPSIRKQSIDELYDRLRSVRVEIRPRRMLHIIADNNNGRIIIAGPERDRKLAGTLRFASEVSDKGSAFVSSGFRLVAEPVDSGRKLKVTWAQLRPGDSSLRQGDAEVTNDLGELLRLVYSNGCGPDDCFLITEAAKRDRLVDAQLSLFPERIKPRIIGEDGQ